MHNNIQEKKASHSHETGSWDYPPKIGYNRDHGKQKLIFDEVLYGTRDLNRSRSKWNHVDREKSFLGQGSKTRKVIIQSISNVETHNYRTRV